MGIEEKPYKKPEFTAEVNLDATGEFAWKIQKGSCLTREAARKVLQALQQMPADRRAVWVRRLDLPASIEGCPVLKEDKEISKELNDLVDAYRGAP